MDHKTSSGARALICFWDGYLGAAPSVLNATRCLVERGYRVDVVARDIGAAFPAPPAMPAEVSVSFLRAPSASAGGLTAMPGFLGKVVRLVFLALDAMHFIFRTARYVRGRDYDLAIGVDMFGLIAANSAARTATLRRLVNWSLEMYFLAELRNPIMRWAKRREAAISRTADLVVIQDMERGHSLATENGFSEDRIACVPNAPMGRPQEVVPGFLQRRLSVGPSARIVLHAGMICEAALSMHLARAAASWPEPYRLVFHERLRRDPTEPYLRAVAHAGGQRVLLSLEPIPFDQLDSVYASAWAGLVFYLDTLGPNFTQSAAASGKLAFYLRNGVPVVVSALPGLQRLVDETGCGIAVTNPADVTVALERIAEDYDGYRQRALACFDRRFDFRRQFDTALQRLAQTVVTPRQS